jgi:choice-of-anchor B domain-containing protein
MKKLLLFLFVAFALKVSSQVYQSYNINILSLSTPNVSDMSVDQRRYSGCWGWYQASKNKEYGITGTSNGTYFIDVTNPLTPTVSAFLQGATLSTYREMKTYQNYCYIVSDDSQNKNFQIVDMQYLPDSIHVVYNDSTLFRRGHTIWIDQDKLYIGAMLDDSLKFSSMTVFSLANPEAPVLLRKLQEDFPIIAYVHDMYVRNDTIYASCAYQGLFVFKYNAVANKFEQLGSYTNYQSSGYNHSSFLTDDGKHLVFCDEVPDKLPMHFVNVENLGNIQPVKDWHPMPETTPHNPYITGNFAVVSCYQDGLHIYDISQPASINLVGYFDTHPQGGNNVGNYFNAPYRGNWGAYPFLPSGIIIANDMQNGMFVLDASPAYTTTIQNPVGIKENTNYSPAFIFYPNPATNLISLHYKAQGKARVQITNLVGQIVLEKMYDGAFNTYLDVSMLNSGTYFISVKEGEQQTQCKKLIIQH